jgi:general stress protein 26
LAKEALMADGDQTQALKKLNGLIHRMKIGMLTTLEDDGSLRSRPMAAVDRDFDGTLWFFTDVDTAKVHEVERQRRVNVAFAHPDQQQYLSLSGTATVLRDHRLFEEFWNPMLKTWFPEGLEDGKLALIRVDALSAEYWDSASGKAVQWGGVTQTFDNERVELGDVHAY